MDQRNLLCLSLIGLFTSIICLSIGIVYSILNVKDYDKALDVIHSNVSKELEKTNLISMIRQEIETDKKSSNSDLIALEMEMRKKNNKHHVNFDSEDTIVNIND